MAHDDDERMKARDLAEKLVGMAREARKHVQEGDVVALKDMLDGLRRDGDDATGTILFLYDVAEAFLRVLIRTDLGTAEVALRRFYVEQPDDAETLLSSLIDRGRVSAAELKSLPPTVASAVENLVNLGALRDLGPAGFDLRPSLRATARDLVAPPVFRMWQQVERCHQHLRQEGLKAQDASVYLASQLGVTLPEAKRHLSHAGFVRRVQLSTSGERDPLEYSHLTTVDALSTSGRGGRTKRSPLSAEQQEPVLLSLQQTAMSN